MKRSILVRQRKGGVGKSAIAIALENALSGAGITMRLIDADSPEEGDEGASFSGVFGARAEQFLIQPNAAAVEMDPNELRRHWFPLCDAIVQGGALIDFGANTNAPFDAALEAGGWSEEFEDAGAELDVVIPITANPEALRGGIEGVESCRKVMPTARIIVALVEKEGAFDPYKADPLYRRLLETRDSGVLFITIPKCVSTLWRPVELARIDFRTAIAAATADPKGFGQQIGGMTRPDVRLGLGKLAEWYDHVVREFCAVGLVPSKE